MTLGITNARYRLILAIDVTFIVVSVGNKYIIAQFLCAFNVWQLRTVIQGVIYN